MLTCKSLVGTVSNTVLSSCTDIGNFQFLQGDFPSSAPSLIVDAVLSLSCIPTLSLCIRKYISSQMQKFILHSSSSEDNCSGNPSRPFLLLHKQSFSAEWLPTSGHAVCRHLHSTSPLLFPLFLPVHYSLSIASLPFFQNLSYTLVPLFYIL